MGEQLLGAPTDAIPALWVKGKSVSTNSATAVIGDNVVVQTPNPRAKLIIGSSGGIAELIVAVGANTGLLFNCSTTEGRLETYGGSLPVTIQSNSGTLNLGGSGGKIGFFGGTAVAKPTGTPAAATDLASAITLLNSLRTSLIALGLIA